MCDRRYYIGAREPPHVFAGGGGGGARHRRLARGAEDAVPSGGEVPHADFHL